MQLIQQQGDSDLGFLQFFNLHRNQHVVHQLVHHPQLTATAAQLLGANRVRLYQVGARAHPAYRLLMFVTASLMQKLDYGSTAAVLCSGMGCMTELLMAMCDFV